MTCPCDFPNPEVISFFFVFSIVGSVSPLPQQRQIPTLTQRMCTLLHSSHNTGGDYGVNLVNLPGSPFELGKAGRVRRPCRKLITSSD